jgi:regulator of protease activity HflC (stomatin/prohibitin superfamily)
VSTGENHLIQRCGKFSRVAHPGFNCLNPLLFESIAGVVSTGVQKLDVESETKTRDNVFVRLTVSVQFRVLSEKIYHVRRLPHPAAEWADGWTGIL